MFLINARIKSTCSFMIQRYGTRDAFYYLYKVQRVKMFVILEFSRGALIVPHVLQYWCTFGSPSKFYLFFFFALIYP